MAHLASHALTNESTLSVPLLFRGTRLLIKSRTGFVFYGRLARTAQLQGARDQHDAAAMKWGRCWCLFAARLQQPTVARSHRGFMVAHEPQFVSHARGEARELQL
jgi:hypothetical protein